MRTPSRRASAPVPLWNGGGRSVPTVRPEGGIRSEIAGRGNLSGRDGTGTKAVLISESVAATCHEWQPGSIKFEELLSVPGARSLKPVVLSHELYYAMQGS